MNLAEFQAAYPTEKSCLKAILKPYSCCGGKFSFRSRSETLVCSCGKTEISPKVGTIFKGSRIPLKTWFTVLFLFSKSKNGISAMEISRYTGLRYNASMRMARKIRSLMVDDLQLSGQVETDESFLGGKRYGGKRGRGAKKQIVLGMVEREGRVVMCPVKSVQAVHLSKPMKRISDGSVLITDELHSYKGIARKRGLEHHSIKHREYMWSLGEYHTNNIESQWSALKRSIKGTYIHVSDQYLPLYLAERCFAYNYSDEERFQILLDRAVSYGSPKTVVGKAHTEPLPLDDNSQSTL